MAGKQQRIPLIISTICIACIDIANIWEYIDTGDPGGIVSNLCFLAATVCIAIGWVHYFIERKRS